MSSKENNTFSANFVSRVSGTVGRIVETISDNTTILNELLPRVEQPIHRNMDEQTIRYDDIKRIRVAGRRGIELPNGRLLAKALDRKQGKPVWVPFGSIEVV